MVDVRKLLDEADESERLVADRIVNICASCPENSADAYLSTLKEIEQDGREVANEVRSMQQRLERVDRLLNSAYPPATKQENGATKTTTRCARESRKDADESDRKIQNYQKLVSKLKTTTMSQKSDLGRRNAKIEQLEAERDELKQRVTQGELQVEKTKADSRKQVQRMHAQEQKNLQELAALIDGVNSDQHRIRTTVMASLSQVMERQEQMELEAGYRRDSHVNLHLRQRGFFFCLRQWEWSIARIVVRAWWRLLDPHGIRDHARNTYFHDRAFPFAINSS